MGNFYKVTKKIHGRYYDYWQKTYRVGKRVKTLNKYIGPSTRGQAAITSKQWNIQHNAWREARKRFDGVDTTKRWGNSALEGHGVNSPAMMEARKEFHAASTAGPLPTYQGYTVDYRLRQFRKVNDNGVIDFIDFKSEEGDVILVKMIEDGSADWSKLHL